MIDNAKVFKNSMMLYIRMVVMMLITLYTSRIVLDTLGIEDYGIYNIIGGVVIMFSFINVTLTIAIRRFLSVVLAAQDQSRFIEVLRASVLAVFIASIIIVIGLETIGLWLLNNKISIPAERMYAANCTFQFSILAFLCNINSVPYNSAIVSCERMKVYTYIGIVESFLKLGLILLLPLYEADKLIVYSIMIFVIAISIFSFNNGYCYFKIARIRNFFKAKAEDIVAIFNFSAWSVLGSIVLMLATQGVNIIINIFFGVTLNAALGIAQQVNSAVNQFLGNFQTAFNPPLTKSYALNGLDGKTFDFVCDTSRMTFLLVMVIGFPIVLNIDGLLNIWLVKVPEYAVEFSTLFILYTVLDGCSGPLYILVYANGKIRGYQILLSTIQIIYVILVYVLCVSGMSPVAILSLNVVNGVLLFAGRLIVLRHMMQFPVMTYLKQVFSSALYPLSLFFICGIFIEKGLSDTVGMVLVIRLALSGVVALVALYFLYLNNRERQFIIKTIQSRIGR